MKKDLAIKRLADMFDAPPPSDVAAERACIAAIVLDDGGGEWGRYSQAVCDRLNAGHYWHWPHPVLHATLAKAYARKINRYWPSWFVGWLKHESAWTAHKTAAILAEIIEESPPWHDENTHIQRVLDCHAARQHYWEAWESMRLAVIASRDHQIKCPIRWEGL